MLTTIDNPYDPFDQFEEWYTWDFNSNYHTPSFLARVANTSESLTENLQSIEIDRAIDEILKENVLGIYRKVSREVEESELG
jgi:hypothetical protein